MLLGLRHLLHPGEPGVWVTQGTPHLPTRSLGTNREPSGHSMGRGCGASEIARGALPGTLTLGSPEGTLGAAPHGGQQQLLFVVARAEGCRASRSPSRRLGQPQRLSPGSQRAAYRFGGHQDATLVFIIHNQGMNPSEEGITARRVAAVGAPFGGSAVVVVVKGVDS